MLYIIHAHVVLFSVIDTFCFSTSTYFLWVGIIFFTFILSRSINWMVARRETNINTVEIFRRKNYKSRIWVVADTYQWRWCMLVTLEKLHLWWTMFEFMVVYMRRGVMYWNDVDM